MTREEVAKELEELSEQFTDASHKLRTGGKLSEVRRVIYDADRFDIPAIISHLTDLEFEKGRVIS